jgi:hypothetical protein
MDDEEPDAANAREALAARSQQRMGALIASLQLIFFAFFHFFFLNIFTRKLSLCSYCGLASSGIGRSPTGRFGRIVVAVAIAAPASNQERNMRNGIMIENTVKGGKKKKKKTSGVIDNLLHVGLGAIIGTLVCEPERPVLDGDTAAR